MSVSLPLLVVTIIGLLLNCSSPQKPEPPVTVLKGLNKKREQVPQLPPQPQLASAVEVKKIEVWSDQSLTPEQKIAWAKEELPPEARSIPKSPSNFEIQTQGQNPSSGALAGLGSSVLAPSKSKGKKWKSGSRELLRSASVRYHPRWRTQNWSKNFIMKMRPEVLGDRLEKMAKEQGVEWVIYRTQKFDTLQKVSRKHYGTDRRWTEIYVLNYPKIKDWDRVLPEMELRLWP